MTFRAAAGFACITCGGAMSVATLDGHTFQRCAACHGVWIAREQLAALLHQHLPTRHRELFKHNDGSPRRACPLCETEMNQVWMEFLAFEQCDRHGLWLDGDKLERALAGRHTPPNLPAPSKKK